MNILEQLKSCLPSYETELPFSKEMVSFSPFKVKDAKNISIILQEDNKKLALNAMVDIVKNNSNIKNIESFCLADIEYLFLQIRSKSVDEVLNLIINGEKQKLCISDIKIKNNLQTETFKLNDKIILYFETPKIKDLLTNPTFQEEDYVKACLKKISINNEIYDLNKFITDELKKLIENLPVNVIEKMNLFVKNDPSLYITYKSDDNESEVNGFLTFFTWR